MGEKATGRIRDIGRVGYTLCRIILVLLAVIVVGVLLGIGMLFKMPKGFSLSLEGDAAVRLTLPEDWGPIIGQQVTGDWKFTWSGLTFSMDHRVRDEEGLLFTGTMALSHITRGRAVLAFSLGLLITAATGFLVWEIGRWCRAFRDDSSPFRQEVSDRLEKVFYTLIAWFVFEKICAAAMGALLLKKLELSFTTGDWCVLSLVALLFLLRFVFCYGIALEEKGKQGEENS